MKKVLFATTALIATTGMAAAEISFGGFGRFGLIYNDGADDETSIEQRFRLNITGTATADNGLEFGARARIETNDGADSDVRAAEFNVESGGFRLDVGNTSDVIDSGDVLDYYGYGVGLTALVETSTNFALPASGISGDGDVPATIKLRYTAGDFTVAASVTDDRDVTSITVASTAGTATANTATTVSREEWQIGFGYNFGNYNVGVAFGNEDVTTTTLVNGAAAATSTNVDNDFWALGFGGEIGAFAFTLLVADTDANPDTAYGVSAKYDVGAATEIRFAYSDTGAAGDDTDAYGIGFRHSLGGGVSLQGGVGEVAGNTVADLGVRFDF
ncbi:porin [Tateyamaria omphalii]|uniref:porin n=1 Tax=Tateyamaria omphalii TaxID=299262 RepID=UPI001673611E|nr:porin [Tateyamaria omphalii]GGX40911.1 porin [Tateyamaria omphalii]